MQPITQVFDALDPDLIECVNETCNKDRRSCSFDVFKAVQTQHALEAVEVDPALGLSDVQKADLVLTKQWLQVKVWQACVTHMALLQADCQIPELRIEYPLHKLAACKVAIDSCSTAALDGNGRCMVSCF